MNKLKEFILNNKIYSKCSEQEQKAILSELERVERNEKALDNACEKLAIMDYKLDINKLSSYENPLSYVCKYKNKEEWKTELTK